MIGRELVMLIESEQLKDVLSLKLNKNINKISESDLETISDLELNSLNIIGEDTPFYFSDLLIFKNLNKLTLNNMYIDNQAITVLTANDKFKSLTFNKCKINNLNFLLKFPLLESLDFSFTPIRDFNIFKNVPLKSFSLAGYTLHDLTFLPSKSLKKLSLINVQIENNDLPSDLLNLEELNLSDTVIGNLKIIKNFTSLKRLIANEDLIQKEKIALFFACKNNNLSITDEHFIPLSLFGEI